MKSLILIGRHWLNRSTGSTSHTVEVITDGHCIAKLGPLHAGNWIDNALGWLEISKLIPAETCASFPPVRLAKLGIEFHASQSNVANKGDL